MKIVVCIDSEIKGTIKAEVVSYFLNLDYKILDYEQEIKDFMKQVNDAKTIFEYKDIYDFIKKIEPQRDETEINHIFTEIMENRKQSDDFLKTVPFFAADMINDKIVTCRDSNVLFLDMPYRSIISYISALDANNKTLRIIDRRTSRNGAMCHKSDWRLYHIWDYTIFRNDGDFMNKLGDAYEFLEQDYKYPYTIQ